MDFINSDIGLVNLFLTFLESLGYAKHDLRYRLSIHESADVEAVKQWWMEGLGLPTETPMPLTLKRHNPSSKRHNAAEDYRGCLVIKVPRPTRLYWRIEGIMKALIGSE